MVCLPWRSPAQATGNAILADLQRQREVIQRARQQAQQTNDSVGQADSLLRKMGKWWRF